MLTQGDALPRNALVYSQLAQLVETARTIIYQLDSETPLGELIVDRDQPIFVKREDTSRIHSYKWRGAFFKMHQLVASGNRGPFVAASAGNHAQGVASAARELDVPATIFMPQSTPQLKQASVSRLGGNWVDVRLEGDCYDDAAQAAEAFAQSSGGTWVKPFDDLEVIAGQATVGLELFQQNPNLTKVYIPIGGGGLASGIGFVNKVLHGRACQVIGVEVQGQNSMQLSRAAGQRVEMKDLDCFCDGTAVSRPGRTTFELCQNLLDEVVTVSNQEVSLAIQTAWECGRFIPEPSGAIGLAAALKFRDQDRSETVGTVISGSNMDFKTLPRVVSQSKSSIPTRKFFRFSIEEKNGTLIELLDQFLGDINIVDFQYGKSHSQNAYPVVGVEGKPDEIHELTQRLNQSSFQLQELTPNAMLEYRVIPFYPELCQDEFFLRIDFPDRPGALRRLMRRISPITNICYFNFVDTGESEGHALIAFEPLQDDARVRLAGHLAELNFGFTHVPAPHG